MAKLLNLRAGIVFSTALYFNWIQNMELTLCMLMEKANAVILPLEVAMSAPIDDTNFFQM